MTTVVERNKPENGADAAGRLPGSPARVSTGPLARREGTVTSLDGVQELLDWARTERARMVLFSLDRAYYLGIETAAEQVLHPEVEAVRSVAWLDRCNPAFVSGYVEAVAMLAPFWSWHRRRCTSRTVRSEV